ncbi:MAG: PEP-CTERM sorting domain-containing protein [Candidatus Spyradenecus sp.]
MRKHFFALLVALLGTTSAYAASVNWSTVSDSWQADGWFHTGFGATTTASFSVGIIFTVPDLFAFTADADSKMLLGVRNSGSSDNAGPSFELWTDGDVKGKLAPQMEGEGYTVTGDSITDYGERGRADVNVLLHEGQNSAVITVDMSTDDRSTTYTLFINGTQVVTGYHFGINEDVYDYQNLAALSGSEAYYMNGIASQEDIDSLPEPTALALLALGVAGVALRRKVA